MAHERRSTRGSLLAYKQPTSPDRENECGETSESKLSEFAPRRTTWNLDAESIIAKLNSHALLANTKGYDTVLPRFSDMASYSISEAEQLELWALEVRRLVDIVNAGDPVTFESPMSGLGYADKEGYDRLDTLALPLRRALTICSLDHEDIMLNYDTDYQLNEQDFEDLKRYLVSQYGSADTCLPDIDDNPTAEGDHRHYHSLVNYITGMLIQVLLRAVEGSLWDDNNIIAVAKLSAKLKWLSFDISQNIKVCLFTISDPSSKHLLHKEKLKHGSVKHQERREGIASAERQYLNVMHHFHGSIIALLQKIVHCLCSNRGHYGIPDSFEIASIVYDAGSSDRILLCQDRWGAIGGSRYQEEIRCTSYVLEVVLATWEKLRLHSFPVSTNLTGLESMNTTACTLVSWKVAKFPSRQDMSYNKSSTQYQARFRRGSTHFRKSEAGRLELAHMKDVITALVPSLMLCGPFSSNLSFMVARMDLLAGPNNAIRACEDVHFLGFFMLQPSNYYDARSSDTTSISTSDIVRRRALITRPLPRWSGDEENDNDNELYHDPDSLNYEEATSIRTINSWIIDETTITIPYRRYCWSVLGFCSGLVLCGLIVGFTVNERIAGVDPFNITTFSWVLSSFIILLFKSLRVNVWLWRDFLRGRVVCRSASEAVNVSGMDPQTFLSILLRQEDKMLLIKRHPFAGVFKNQSRESDVGFAIDIPLSTEALINSGNIPIAVQTHTGPIILLLYLSPIGRYNSVPWIGSKRDKGPAYIELDTSPPWGDGDSKAPLHRVSYSSFHWTRILGLYSGKAWFR